MTCMRWGVLAMLSLVIFGSCRSKRSGKPRVLVFTKTAGYHHASIPAGVNAILQLGHANNFDVDTTSDASRFQEDSLKQYAAVVFLHTTGDLLNNFQEADFERYIQAGGGYAGIHAAADAEYDWGWYGRLVGAWFHSHPEQQEAVLNVVDSTNDATRHLPHSWKRKDEWYNFKNLNKDVHVLLTIDEKSYHGGINGDHHPMAWYHDYDGGRAWYTELGHTEESYSDPLYLNHILAGIKYAIGDNQAPDYSKATTLRVPEQDRFTKRTLVEGVLYEPTEMTILPNLDVLIVQRRGEFMLYKHAAKTIKQAGFLNVYFKTKGGKANSEEGLLGIQADPDFQKNHYVYVMYSPVDTSVDRLSRFTFNNDTLDNKSEKVILQFYSQREICCHTGGSIAFGKDHTLFFSTGDNSTPFDEPNQRYNLHSFAPLDDRPGFTQYDSRRGAGNTNDLRGKIIRITINEDGSYSIPDGNLFAKGTANTRPEIYVMGNRNPYRISVDKKNGFLYWGEVGPDANADSLDTRGPRGYDEVNQARKAGNFGWPYFVGNNYAYHEYDFATGTPGPAFDPQRPVNNSRNNTGLRELPPAQPAFIWYPYGESKEFPQVGTGGRTAMAGPVYHTDMYPDSTRLPDYYNNKLIIYEWIRGWIKAVTMWPNGDFSKMEPFAPGLRFNAPIDMETGPDGKIYVLEYGSGWFAKNPDAGLSVIDYNAGNRPPAIGNITVNKTSGDIPLTVTAKADVKDPEHDPITYRWHIGNTVKETHEPSLEYTISKIGDYAIQLEAVDDKNASSSSNTVNVYAGNEAPLVKINISGNKTFYFPGKKVSYTVLVEDKDDTAKTNPPGDMFISADYVEGADRAAVQGHQMMTQSVMGKNLMLSLDCKTCHKINDKSIGPSFTDVAKRYQKEPDGGVPHLAEKIMQGGSGVWGEVAMPAHPALKETDARLIVGWIKSLSVTAAQKSLPSNGSLNPTLGEPVKDNGALTIMAMYTDKGGNNIKPLSASDAVVLRNSKMGFRNVKKMRDFTIANYNGVNYAVIPKNTGWFAIENIDLSGVQRIALAMEWIKQPVPGYDFELRLDAPDGKQIGALHFGGASGELPAGKRANAQVTTKISPVTDGNMHAIYIVSKSVDPSADSQAGLKSIQFFDK